MMLLTIMMALTSPEMAQGAVPVPDGQPAPIAAAMPQVTLKITPDMLVQDIFVCGGTPQPIKPKAKRVRKSR